jgi:hypothetical protein
VRRTYTALIGQIAAIPCGGDDDAGVQENDDGGKYRDARAAA